MDFHLTPAYGRDYKSKAEVLAAWQAGKDFILATTGQYCSIRDLKDSANQVWIRYRNLRMIVRAQ
jgi:hypothetical protein